MTQVTVGRTLGAIEIGGFISVFLFGVLCAQVYVHYKTAGMQLNIPDRAVVLVLCLDLGHTISVTHATYTAIITWYGDPRRVDEVIAVPSMPLSVLFSSLVEFVVRVVYARRIQKFSGKRYIPWLCYAVSALTCSAGLWVSLAAFQAKEFSRFMQQWTWLLIATLSGIVVSDCLIVGALCYYLTKSEKWLGSPSKLVEKLKLWTIETGLLTSLTALAQLICFQTMDSTFFAFVAIYMCLPKLYSNCLLALLNGRATLRAIPPISPELTTSSEMLPAPF